MLHGGLLTPVRPKRCRVGEAVGLNAPVTMSYTSYACLEGLSNQQYTHDQQAMRCA